MCNILSSNSLPRSFFLQNRGNKSRKKNWYVPEKTGIILHIRKVIPYYPATIPPWHLPSELKTQRPHKNLYKDVCSCFVENLKLKCSSIGIWIELRVIQTRNIIQS